MLLGAAATCATCQTLAVVAFVFVLSIVTAAAFGLWVRCFLGSSTSFLTALSEFSSLRSYFTWATAQFSVFTCPTSALHIATYLVLQLFSLQQSGEKSEKVTKKLLEKIWGKVPGTKFTKVASKSEQAFAALAMLELWQLDPVGTFSIINQATLPGRHPCNGVSWR